MQKSNVPSSSTHPLGVGISFVAAAERNLMLQLLADLTRVDSPDKPTWQVLEEKTFLVCNYANSAGQLAKMNTTNELSITLTKLEHVASALRLAALLMTAAVLRSKLPRHFRGGPIPAPLFEKLLPLYKKLAKLLEHAALLSDRALVGRVNSALALKLMALVLEPAVWGVGTSLAHYSPAKQRKQQAQNAAKARWAKHRKEAKKK